jgi:hypothetical protein
VASLDWLWAALIGVAGSAVGGLVVGRYAIRAGHKQWERDREDSRTDRSRQSAIVIAGAVGAMEVAIVKWQAEPADPVEIAALMAAFNMFSVSVTVQSLALTDVDLRSRVRAHQTFVGILGAQAGQGGTAPQRLAGRVRMHADIVLEALGAYVNGTPLPRYQPLPLTDDAALARWTPTGPTPDSST